MQFLYAINKDTNLDEIYNGGYQDNPIDTKKIVKNNECIVKLQRMYRQINNKRIYFYLNSYLVYNKLNKMEDKEIKDHNIEMFRMKKLQPDKPVNLSLYSCAASFQIAQLKKELLVNESPYGFIIVDGQGALYATLQGNSLQIINTFTVQLPKKDNKGFHSIKRFQRIRNNYLRKVCQNAVQCFISENKCNVAGLVLAGRANFKNYLNSSQMFDPRLQSKVINVVDVSYGFKNGLSQAIQKSVQVLQNVKQMKQKEIISNFFQHIALGDNLVVYGVQQTMKYLETGVVGKILCYENLDYVRIKLKNPITGMISIVYTKTQNVNNPQILKEGDAQLEVVNEQNEETSLPEWLAHHYKDFGCELQFLTDKSTEGTQFLNGFAGFGGFLRYKVELNAQQVEYVDEDSDEDFI